MIGIKLVLQRALLVALTLTTSSTVAVTSTASAAGPWCNQIAIVGDSLTANGNAALHAQFPKAIINARGRRYTAEGAEAAWGIDSSNNVDCWVFALGTNDLFGWHDWTSSRTAIDSLLAYVGPTDHVWWILPQVTTASGLSPTVFDSAVPNYAGPVDIHTPLADFLPDGIHLTPVGYQHRAAAIAAGLAS